MSVSTKRQCERAVQHLRRVLVHHPQVRVLLAVLDQPVDRRQQLLRPPPAVDVPKSAAGHALLAALRQAEPDDRRGLLRLARLARAPATSAHCGLDASQGLEEEEEEEEELMHGACLVARHRELPAALAVLAWCDNSRSARGADDR